MFYNKYSGLKHRDVFIYKICECKWIYIHTWNNQIYIQFNGLDWSLLEKYLQIYITKMF